MYILLRITDDFLPDKCLHIFKWPQIFLHTGNGKKNYENQKDNPDSDN